jgi:putative Holliday junction resolvase
MSIFVGIDFGESRIGVAISDEQKKIAFPLGVLHREKGSYGLKSLKRLLDDRDADRFVVGLPVRSDGTVGTQGEKVLLFIDALHDYFNRDVVTWDERYTTVIASNVLREGSTGSKKGRKVVDKIAAQIILQSYLDHSNST